MTGCDGFCSDLIGTVTQSSLFNGTICGKTLSIVDEHGTGSGVWNMTVTTGTMSGSNSGPFPQSATLNK
jgi:hypothetical protein